MIIDMIKFIFNARPKVGRYAGKIFGTKITVVRCKDGIVTYYFSKSACPEIRLMTYRQFHITGYRKENEIYYEEGEAIGHSCLKDKTCSIMYEFIGKNTINEVIK